MRHPQAFWSILVVVILLLAAAPITYMRVTGNRIIFPRSIKTWTRPLDSVEITAHHADGSQDWIKVYGPIAIASKNVSLSPNRSWKLTGTSFTIRSHKGLRTVHASAIYGAWQ